MEAEYPTVVVLDRYGGVYSGGKWVAFNEEDVPVGAQGDDTDADIFWSTVQIPYGTGNTPDEAVAALNQKTGFGQ